MKILVFTEGTILIHASWVGLPRGEIFRRVQAGEIPGYEELAPIGSAVEKLQAWKQQGAEISYLTSRLKPGEISQVRQVLRDYNFPEGQLLFRQPGEAYRDVAERILPDILVEDDCESIGGEIEMTYPGIQTELKRRIKPVVVKEFGGIDHLPDRILDLG
jgi:hypothetical protein